MWCSRIWLNWRFLESGNECLCLGRTNALRRFVETVTYMSNLISFHLIMLRYAFGMKEDNIINDNVNSTYFNEYVLFSDTGLISRYCTRYCGGRHGWITRDSCPWGGPSPLREGVTEEENTNTAHNCSWHKWKAWSPTGVLQAPSCGSWCLSWVLHDEYEQVKKDEEVTPGLQPKHKATKQESTCEWREWEQSCR